MKSVLSKRFSNSQKGFTLVELLVAVTIVVIMATIGLVIYSQVQVGIRDTKRVADINNLSQVMETHYNNEAGSGCSGGLVGTYCKMSNDYFQNGVVPVDPRNGTTNCKGGTCKYCVLSALPAAGATSACTSGSTQVSDGTPANGVSSYIFCTNMEKDNSAPGGKNYYCKSNQQ
jgi:prepilin-type N-terminal cleavage/methylation domain-containing protein